MTSAENVFGNLFIQWSFTYCFAPVILGSVGGIGSGTALETGGRDFRYAKIALRSASGIWPMNIQGMGGRICRPCPMSLPVRIAPMNVSSVQLPMPVATSGVRFFGKLTPHGPYHAVRSFVVIA